MAARWFGAHARASKSVRSLDFSSRGRRPLTLVSCSFLRLGRERIPYGIQRYIGETERLYGVLDIRLKGRKYLVGEKYSIADIAVFSWVNVAYLAGIDLADFPNLHKWWERINKRPAVQRGLKIPTESRVTNAAYLKRLQADREFREAEEEYVQMGRDAKELYGYKFTAP